MNDRLHSALTVAMAVLFISLVLGVGYAASNPQVTTEPYSEYYILGANQSATTYPVNLTTGESANVTFGISNHEHRPARYRVSVEWNGSTAEERELRIPDGETRERTVELAAPNRPGRYKLEFHFDKGADGGEPEATTRLWIRVVDES